MGSGKILMGAVIVCCVLCGWPESAAGYNPKFFTLDIGQTCTDAFGGAVSRSVKLLDVVDCYEMGYWQGGLRKICYKSTITLAVDGVEGTVGCGPFYMPVVINGLRICGELTRAFTIDSTAIPEMSEAVLLSAKDASMPWYDPGRFAFPSRSTDGDAPTSKTRGSGSTTCRMASCTTIMASIWAGCTRTITSSCR